ncbi:MAG: hypothetical protein ABEJ35_04880 [Halobacteriaceae archaeon]
MSEDSPLESPDGHWWDREVNRRETIWLGLTGTWAAVLFGWMVGWTQVGGQNQIGPTYKVSPAEFQDKVSSFKDDAGTRTIDGTEALVPPATDSGRRDRA